MPYLSLGASVYPNSNKDMTTQYSHDKVYERLDADTNLVSGFFLNKMSNHSDSHWSRCAIGNVGHFHDEVNAHVRVCQGRILNSIARNVLTSQ